MATHRPGAQACSRVLLAAMVAVMGAHEAAWAGDRGAPLPVRKSDATDMPMRARERDRTETRLASGSMMTVARGDRPGAGLATADSRPTLGDPGSIRIAPVRRQRPVTPDRPAALKAWLSQF